MISLFSIDNAIYENRGLNSKRCKETIFLPLFFPGCVFGLFGVFSFLFFVFFFNYILLIVLNFGFCLEKGKKEEGKKKRLWLEVWHHSLASFLTGPQSLFGRSVRSTISFVPELADLAVRWQQPRIMPLHEPCNSPLDIQQMRKKSHVPPSC